METIEDQDEFENFADQDEIDFCDDDIEDVQKLTDEEYFDFLEMENSKQSIKKIIDKVLEKRI